MNKMSQKLTLEGGGGGVKIFIMVNSQGLTMHAVWCLARNGDYDNLFSIL